MRKCYYEKNYEHCYPTTFTFFAGCGNKVETLNFAVELNDHAAAAYVAKDRGDYAKYGIEVHSFEQYATGVELAAALSRGDINIGYICVVPAVIAYSRGVPIKIVTGTHEYGYELVSKQEIKDVKELNGKKIACPGQGTSSNFVLRLVEEKYNIKFNVLRTKPIGEISALTKGAVDAVFIPEHYASILTDRGFKLLLRSQDVFPGMPGSCIVVKDNIIQDKPNIVKNLIRLNAQELKFVNKNPEETAKILAKAEYLNTKPGIIENSMKNFHYTDKLDKEKIQFIIDKLAEWGYIKKFNVKDIVWKGNEEVFYLSLFLLAYGKSLEDCQTCHSIYFHLLVKWF